MSGDRATILLSNRPSSVEAAQGRRAASGWVPPLLLLGCAVGLVALERRWPLRRDVEPRNRHDIRNLAVAVITALALQLGDRPVTDRLARLVETRRWGLLQCRRMPPAIEAALGLILMDYTLFVWHVLLHRVPGLWRCHLVHHVDLDLSASTALRFHFSEMLLSVPWRAAQILLIGIRPPVLKAWQTATLAEVLFQHSNLNLTRGVERFLQYLIVTPRLHGIHHSTVREETHSNWSSGLTLWDRLHGTLRSDIPQRAIAIGTPAWRDPAELSLVRILEMPFGKQRPAWRHDEPSAGADERSGQAGALLRLCRPKPAPAPRRPRSGAAQPTGRTTSPPVC